MSVPDASEQPLAEPQAPGAPAQAQTNYFNVINPISGYVCASCLQVFRAEEVLDQHGTIICKACYSAALARRTSDEDFLSAHPLTPEPTEEPVASEADHLPAPVIMPGDDEDAADVDLAPVQEASATASASSRQPISKASNDFLPLLIGGAVGVIALAAVIIYINTGPSDVQVAANNQPAGATAIAPSEARLPSGPTEWELKNAPHLERLRAQAKSMEAAGDKAGALSRYQEMLDLAGSPGARIGNDAVRAELTDARGRWEILIKEVNPVDRVPSPATADSFQQPAVPKNPSNAKSSAPPITPQVGSVSPQAPRHSASGNDSPEAKPPITPSTVEKPTPPTVVEDNGNWPANHLVQLQQLIADAQESSKGGDKVLALAKFEQILRIVQGHEKQITDPELKQKMAAANEQRKQLLAAVRDSDETRQATAHSLLEAGLKSLHDSKWKTALESFSDARHLAEKMASVGDRLKSPDYVSTLHGLAVAYLENKNFQRAGEMFDDAAPLGRVAALHPTREMIWNRAVTDISQKFNVMRTVKLLRDYLEKHPDPPDEDLINLFGTALNTADESNPTNRKMLDDAIGYYGVLNAQLEKLRPGQKRWGVQWLSEADAQAKYDDQGKYIEAFQQKQREKEMATVKVKEAQQNAAGIRRPAGAEAAVTAAKNELAAAERAAQAARAAIPRAPWLMDLKPMIPSDTQVAMAAASPAAATPPVSSGSALPPEAPPTPSSTDPRPSSESKPPASPAAENSAPAPTVVVPPRELRYAAAFPVDKTHLLTASDPLGNSREVRIEDTQGNVLSARVVARQDRLALLEVSPSDVPGGSLRYFNLALAYSGGPVRCVAIPEANVFGPAAALINGESVPVPKGPKWAVGLAEHPRLAGSPLIDADNSVVGVVVADREDPRSRLPAITVKEVMDFLQARHVGAAAPSGAVDPTGIYQVSAESE